MNGCFVTAFFQAIFTIPMSCRTVCAPLCIQVITVPCVIFNSYDVIMSGDNLRQCPQQCMSHAQPSRQYHGVVDTKFCTTTDAIKHDFTDTEITQHPRRTNAALSDTFWSPLPFKANENSISLPVLWSRPLFL